MTTAYDWAGDIGDVWAQEWQRTDRSFTHLSRILDQAIVEAAPASGRALDVGCGAGSTALALAAARPDLAITGIDLSEALVAAARGRAAAITTLDFRVADAATDQLPSPLDLIVSRHGVMFFADPVDAFSRLHAAAVPGARLVFSCFADPAANAFADPLVAAITGVAPERPPGYAPGPFGFADRGLVATLLADAGWADAEATRVDYGYVAGAGAEPLADAVSFFSRIGPVAQAIAGSPDRAALLDRLAAALEHYTVGDTVTLPASAWIWRARA